MFWLGFLLGGFVGAAVGVLVVSLCAAAAEADRRAVEVEELLNIMASEIINGGAITADEISVGVIQASPPYGDGEA